MPPPTAKPYPPTIFATDYGVLANGTDKTAQMQAFANALMAQGGPAIGVLPAGTILVTSTINFRNPGTTGMAMPRLMGAGNAGANTTIHGRLTVAGPVVRIRGIPAVGAPVTTLAISTGGGLEGFIIDATDSVAGTVGLEMLGWWGASHRDLTVQRCSSHGIQWKIDTAWDANPDWSACNGHVFTTCNMVRCGGYGWHNADIQGAAQMLMYGGQIALCYAGGALINSTSVSFNTAAVSEIGWSSESTPTDGNPAYGLEYAWSQKSSVINCELQECKTGIIALGHTNTIQIIGNRIIVGNTHVDSAILRPPALVEFGYKGAGDFQQGNIIDGNFYRIDNIDTVASPTFTLYKANPGSGANCEGNIIRHRSGVYAPTVVVVPQTGFDTGNHSLLYNNVVDVNVDQNFGGPCSYLGGAPKPFMQASITNATAIAVNAFTPLVADVVSGLCNSSHWPWKAFYNTTTGVFTAPASGFYRMTADIVINPAANTDYPEFWLMKTSSTYIKEWFFEMAAAMPDKAGWHFSHAFEATAGESFRLDYKFIGSGQTFSSFTTMTWEAVFS